MNVKSHVAGMVSNHRFWVSSTVVVHVSNLLRVCYVPFVCSLEMDTMAPNPVIAVGYFAKLCVF
jgi:hypothetical protein